MAWFEDLSPCDYFGEEYAADLRAVGWLSRGHPYQTGSVPRALFDKLCQLLRQPWTPVSFMGYHECEFCRFTGGASTSVTIDSSPFVVPGQSCANLFVPGERLIYVAPESIVHYIDAHGYRPPDEFVDAVMRCPRMSSAKYFGAIRANGGEFGRRETRIADEQCRRGVAQD
jgi:hypothetical protein